MSLKERLVAYLPAWLRPLNPWGSTERSERSERHALADKQEELSWRIDRLAQREAEERQRYREWDQHYDG